MKKFIILTALMTVSMSVTAMAEVSRSDMNALFKKYIIMGQGSYNELCDILKPTEMTTNMCIESTTEATTQSRPEVTTEATTQSRPEATTEATTQSRPEATTEATTQSRPEATTEVTTSASSSTDESTAKSLLNLVNNARTKEGLSPLTLNNSLSAVAQKKAEDMKNNNYFSHTSPTYGTPFDMIKSAGISYNTAGENIAKGQKSAEAVFNAWMNSHGHRANILNSRFTQMGIGVTNGSSKYWSQMFIG